jgi:hypothetical protein
MPTCSLVLMVIFLSEQSVCFIVEYRMLYCTVPSSMVPAQQYVRSRLFHVRQELKSIAQRSLCFPLGRLFLVMCILCTPGIEQSINRFNMPAPIKIRVLVDSSRIHFGSSQIRVKHHLCVMTIQSCSVILTVSAFGVRPSQMPWQFSILRAQRKPRQYLVLKRLTFDVDSSVCRKIVLAITWTTVLTRVMRHSLDHVALRINTGVHVLPFETTSHGVYLLCSHLWLDQ